MKEYKRPYESWTDLRERRKQIEIKEPVRLLDDNGNLLVKGWARRNIFEYDRTKARPQWRGKEWDFYQISNGRQLVQISTANISVAGYAMATFIDFATGETHSALDYHIGGKNKYVLPANGNTPNYYKYKHGKAELEFDTRENYRTIKFKGASKSGRVECDFHMDMFDNHENITIVTPFKDMPTRFFLTMKQNSMPCSGTFRVGDKIYEFSKEDTFCVLDWGRGVWPYKNCWYWGNGAKYITDDKGNKHIFGFEITWGIGDESFASETCLFLDGKAHKIGAVDVEKFPKGKWMQPWHFVSDDGKFDMTMTPFYNNATNMNVLGLLKMQCDQLHGIWNGTVVLEDNTKLEIKDMYAFCEYVENLW
ncbi:MAG: DUF2804 domain-containing protein [Christensenellales bacterium]|jgi:hypothetical protein